MLPDEYYIRLYLTITSSLFVIAWMFLYFRYGRKFKENIEAINKDVFFLPDIFFIGYGVIDLFHINIYAERGQKRMKLLREIMPARRSAILLLYNTCCTDYVYYDNSPVSYINISICGGLQHGTYRHSSCCHTCILYGL